MKTRASTADCATGYAALVVACLSLSAVWPAAGAVGTWTSLTRAAPARAGHMLLLSDGTVMVQHADDTLEATTNWYRLTPDNTGNYAGGTWTTIAPSRRSHVFYESFVLQDGRVAVAGGEYGTGTNEVEVYDPVVNAWTLPLLSPVSIIRDGCSELLPNGNLLVFPNPYTPPFTTLIYDPKANTWSMGPLCLASQDEASWIKLPDDSILTIDRDSTTTERYIPSLGKWIADAPLPPGLLLWSNVEIGPALLLPNGKAFFLGGSGQTGIYTASGTTNPGSWTPGTNLPNGLVIQDGPAAMLVNGKIICAAHAPGANNSGPVYFYEYDYLANSFAPVNSPTGGSADYNCGANRTSLLALPDGRVLFNDNTTQLYVYNPNPTTPVAAGKPVIISLSANADGSFLLTGTGFNGISAGAAFGDDAQMNSNYPLVRLTDGAGNVYYARTYNWSSTGVRTGSRVVSTQFSVPTGLGTGLYSLVVVANGIGSDPVPFAGPVWVDFNYGGTIQAGTYVFPYPTLAQGVSAVPAGGSIKLKTAGTSPERLTISKPTTIIAVGGPATIGQQ